MSATLQTSSTKLDVASTLSSMPTSPAAGVGEGAVATPFATLFSAVQASEEAPTQTVVGETLTREEIGVRAETAIVEGGNAGEFEEDLNGEAVVVFEQTNSILVPRQNLKPEETGIEGEELTLDAWPAFAAVPAWSILPEDVVLAEPVGADLPVNLTVNLEDVALLDEGQSLLIEPVDLELSADFAEQFAPKLLVAQGEQAVPVIDGLPTEDPLLKTIVTSIEPMNTAGPIKLAVAAPAQIEAVKIQSPAAGRQNIDVVSVPAMVEPNVETSQLPIATKTIEGPFGLAVMELDPALGVKNPVGNTAEVLASPVIDVVDAELSTTVAGPVLASTTAPLLASQAPIKGASGPQSSLDLANPAEDLAVDLDVPVDVPMPENAVDVVRSTTSVHPLAATATVAPKRGVEVEKNQVSVDGLNEDVLSDDGQLEPVVTRPAIQTPLGNGVTNRASPQATRVVREAAIQRAVAQSNLEQSLPKDDPNVEPTLAPAQASATTSTPSNVASQTAPTAFASSAGAAAVLDVRRQGWTKTLVNRAASMAQAGGSMTLSILPQNLGQITLRLSDGRKGLELRMTAEVASTTAMLRDVQGQIESAFDQAGLKLGSYSAQTGGQGQHGGSNQNAPQDDGEIELRERNAPTETDRIGHENTDRLNILL